MLAREHDYLYDEKHKTVSPTEPGIEKVERALKIEQPLRARATCSSSTT